MPTIFRDTPPRIRVLHSEKTSLPYLAKMAKGTDADDYQQGELLGLAARLGYDEVVYKITTANEVQAAMRSMMRLNRTKYDSEESGKLTLIEGLYYVETEYYVPQQYAYGELLTCRFDPAFGHGVWGPVGAYTDADGGSHAAAQTATGQIVAAPTNPDDNSPLVVKVFSQPQIL